MTPEPRDVIAAAIDEFMVHPLETGDAADRALAALRAAGYETYRPEECESVEVSAYLNGETYVSGGAITQCRDEGPFVDVASGTYRLVRASDDTEGE